MESALYLLWKINTRNLVKNEVLISKNYNIPPSEIERKVFYEYEWILEEIKEIQTIEQEESEKQNSSYSKMTKPNMGSMMNSAKASMPNMGSFSMPKVSMPKF